MNLTTINRVYCNALLLLILAFPSVLMAQSPSPCVLGYTVGFFNGVWNTEMDAFDGLNAIQFAGREATANSDDTFHDEDVVYQLFYNHTGSTVGSFFLQDLAEVFIQRANQLDPSMYVSTNNFYLFWESFSGTNNFTSNIDGPTLVGVLNFLSAFSDTAVASAVSSLSKIFFAPSTAADYVTQDATLATLAGLNRKLVLVAHSQGNLFVDPAYDYIQPIVGSDRVATVHIAPASPTLRGPPLYILSSNDLVINALRLDGGFGTVPMNTITIPAGVDFWGHQLVPTYLDPARSGRAQTESLLLTSLESLQQPNCQMSVTPASSAIAAGAVVNLTAAIDPAPMDVRLSVEYQWRITGNAGGVFSSTSGTATQTTTTDPSVTYVSSESAVDGQIDTISVKAFAGEQQGDISVAESIASSEAQVEINAEKLTLSPSSVIVTPGATQQFVSSVPATQLDWSVLEGSACGSVTALGVYTAPQIETSCHVVVSDRANPDSIATALVDVIPAIAEIHFGNTVTLLNTIGGEPEYTISWDHPFSSINYTAVCNPLVVDKFDGGAYPMIINKTPSQVTIVALSRNQDPNYSQPTIPEVDCIGVAGPSTPSFQFGVIQISTSNDNLSGLFTLPNSPITSQYSAVCTPEFVLPVGEVDYNDLFAQVLITSKAPTSVQVRLSGESDLYEQNYSVDCIVRDTSATQNLQAGVSSALNLEWLTSFPDVNYSAVCSVEAPDPSNEIDDIIANITSKSANGVVLSPSDGLQVISAYDCLSTGTTLIAPAAEARHRSIKRP